MSSHLIGLDSHMTHYAGRELSHDQYEQTGSLK